MIYLDINIPHLKIAHLGGNLEVGNLEIHQCSRKGTNSREIIKAAKVMQMPSTLV